MANSSRVTFFVGSISLLCLSLQGAPQYLQIDYKKLIDEFYKEVSGYKITDTEKKGIRDLGGDPTYGEIVYDSAAILLHDLNLTSHDVFYDLGSGAGKFVDQAYLTTPVKKSAGIELSETRYKMAAERAPKIRKIAQLSLEFDAQLQEVIAETADKKADQKVTKPKVTKALEFIQGNMLTEDLSDATAIFMCATCFSDELMEKITQKLAGLKEGLRVLTLKNLAPHEHFKLVKTYTLPMTWSKTSPVYLYLLDRTEPEEAMEVDEIEEATACSDETEAPAPVAPVVVKETVAEVVDAL